MNQALQRLPGSPGCFICDNNSTNPRALRLTLLWDEAAETVRIPCEPDATWCGFEDVVHGGLIASVLDEAMAWAVKQTVGDWAFTADYRLRFKRAVAPGHAYEARGKIVQDAGRKIEAEAQFVDGDGTVLAQASAIFIPAKGRAKAREA